LRRIYYERCPLLPTTPLPRTNMYLIPLLASASQNLDRMGLARFCVSSSLLYDLQKRVDQQEVARNDDEQ